MAQKEQHELSPEDPPPYPAEQSPVELGHRPREEHTFDTIQQHIEAAKHSYEFRRDGGRLLVLKCASGEGRLMFDSPLENANPGELMLYHANSNGHIAARARLPRRAGGFEFLVGSSPKPGDYEWRAVECRHSGFLKADSYHFVAGSSCKKLVWHCAQEFVLDPAKADWKLEDESEVGQLASKHKWHHALPGTAPLVIAGGTEIARYHRQRSRASSSASAEQSQGLLAQGTISWADEHERDMELAALVVLLVIIQCGAAKR